MAWGRFRGGGGGLDFVSNGFAIERNLGRDLGGGVQSREMGFARARIAGDGFHRG